MQKKQSLIFLALAAAASLTLLSGCDGFGSEAEPTIAQIPAVTDTTFCKGIVICGIDMDGKTKEEALELLKKQEQAAPDPISITLTMDDRVFHYTEEDLLFDTDYEAAVDEAYNALYSGTPAQYYAKKLFLADHPQSSGASQSLNEQSVETLLNSLADQLDQDPTEGKLLSFNGKKFTFSEGEPGISIDRDKLIADVIAALKESSDVSATIEYTVVEPESSSNEVSGEMQALATFSTVSTNNENGNLNMALALQYVNGTILNVGDTFSFNTIVGDSTNNSRGFVEAGVIINGKLQEDYGGGICQASTTIYGAVIRTANLTIVERYNHMWPSTYVPIGQDAAVDYGNQDFCFRNDTDGPIYIECGMEGTKLTVTLYGVPNDDYDEIAITSEQTGTMEAPDPVFQLDTSLKKGEVETDRTERTGYTATAQQTFYKNGKVVKTEDLPSSYYPAIGAIYRYGKGTDLSSYQ